MVLAERSLYHGGQQIQVTAIRVLDDVITRPQSQGLDGNLLISAAGDHHDRWQGALRSQAADDLQSVIDGHGMIQQQQVIGAGLVQSQALLSIWSVIQDIAVPLQCRPTQMRQA